MSEFSKRARDPLDEALASLPKDVAPQRDLWPQIRAEIEKTPIAAPAPRPQSSWFRLAAGVLLVLGSSLVTYYVTRQSMQQQIAQTAPQTLPTPQLTGQAVSFTFGPERLGAEYMSARAELDKLFQQRVASLPPAARAKVENNLADLRRAADEISRTLAEHPSDPLLQELLMSTYQSELRLLADVSELPTAGSMRTEL